MTYKHGNVADYMPDPSPTEEISARFDRFETFPERFGAATVVIENLERKIAYLSEGLRDIRDNKWSGERCRDSAAYTLERADKI